MRAITVGTACCRPTPKRVTTFVGILCPRMQSNEDLTLYVGIGNFAYVRWHKRMGGTMQLNTAHDLRHVIQDARQRLGWSQSRLAEAVGASRQWISLVENGKTSVEFDIVFDSLRALGYTVHLEQTPRHRRSPTPDRSTMPIRDPSGRTFLTRDGKPLGRPRSKRQTSERD